MIHYKHSNPSSINNTTSGYALNDFWVNIVTYTKYEQISNGEWVWRESNYGSEMSYQRLNQQAGSIVTNDSLYGDGTLDNPLTNKPKLDFLLVDLWDDLTGLYPDNFVPIGGSYNLVIDSQDVRLFKYDFNGIDTTMITPISKTTIFVHPTTFERYRFNGTTMEVYDDVDGIVPKWLEYKAYAKQLNGELIAYPTNKDEYDYLGDINWFTNSIDPYWSSGKFKEKELLDLKAINVDGSIPLCFSLDVNGEGLSFDKINEGNDWDGIYLNFKQRLRGAPPKLLSAETNTTGDKVILTFDKKMNIVPANDSNNGGGQYNGFAIVGSYLGGLLGSGNQKDNVIESMCDPILNGEIITIYYNPASLEYPGNSVESLDFGLLQPFENFPVTNNVPAPPQLIDAYTNETGNKITMVFDKELSAISLLNNQPLIYTAADFYVNSIAMGTFDHLEVEVSEDKKCITLTTDPEHYLVSGEIISIDFYSSNDITSVDGGVLRQFSNYPVTNNVI